MRIYFCTDIHGSRKCWKKFLAAAKFYGADHIVVGGDITGKFIVPIVERAGRVKTARFMGVERRVGSTAELENLKTRIADAGQYAYETTPDEEAWLGADQARVDALFKRLAVDRVDAWVAEADEQLRGSGVRVFVSGANDDFFEVDEVLARSEIIEDPNGRVIDLDGGFQIVGMGFANMTPWACPRDIGEDELAARIDTAVAGVRDMSRAIFNLHAPPFDSGLDLAPRLDAELRPVVTGGGADMIPVGSTAVRAAVARYRPLIGLHGHIHESKGIRKIDGITVANPGSEYGEGILDGLVVDLDPTKGLGNVQLVTG